jgi:hypothetical protein
MEFKELLEIYKHQLYFIKRHQKLGSYTDDYLMGRRHANFRWFQDMLLFVVNREYEILDATEEELKAYEHDGDWPSRLISYRGEIIPVFIDDYGQQLFTVIRGEEHSGGSFNIDAEEDFMYQMDAVLEEEFLGDGDLCRDDG